MRQLQDEWYQERIGIMELLQILDEIKSPIVQHDKFIDQNGEEYSYFMVNVKELKLKFNLQTYQLETELCEPYFKEVYPDVDKRWKCYIDYPIEMDSRDLEYW